MTNWPPHDLHVEAKLLGILLAGVFGQTRRDESSESRSCLELTFRAPRRFPFDPSSEPER